MISPNFFSIASSAPPPHKMLAICCISATIPSRIHRLPFSFPSPNSYPQHQPFSGPQRGRQRRRRELPVIVHSGKFFAELTASEEEWIKKLPNKKKPLYSHSLPCIESWLRSLGFYQSRDDRADWIVEKDEWHAQLSLDVTDIYIRYLKSGPGNLEKDVERRFSYALSREDIENAVLGGP